jgi:hypothetical protein
MEPCPKDKDGNWPICITIPVKEDFSFDWNGMKITPENQREDLFYLKFKTSDSDGLVKYVFGDIYFEKKVSIKKNGSIDISESGYYRLDNPGHNNAAYRPSSFYRGLNDFKDIIKSYEENNSSVLRKFHEKLEENIKLIERILKYTPAVLYAMEVKEIEYLLRMQDNEEDLYVKTVERVFGNLKEATLKKLQIPLELIECNESQKRLIFDLNNIAVFIHFEFPGRRHWYTFESDMELINSKVLSDFVDYTQNGIVLKKTLYKTLCSGDKKNDIQFPSFSDKNKHKAKNFESESLQDLFYAIDYTSKGKLITGTDIKLIVLPRGEHLSAKDYEDFLEKRDEAKILAKNKENILNLGDPIFDFFSDEDQSITSFDLIFCKKGGLSSPDSDLIELSGIEKSNLRLLRERIHHISQEISTERKAFFLTEKELFPLTIDYSFRDIIGNPQADPKTGKISFKANPKYQSHLLKVLPLIYTENYHQDEALLPAFIQNAECSIRAGDTKYSFLKFEFKFLMKIQNTKTDRFMEIITSESYQIGFMLGGMAKNLSQEINSFEKNYVGNLTRRVGTLSDFIKLKNEIEQKLIMHDKSKFTFQTSYDLAQKVKEFNTRYDKEECAFGFMESYFKPLPKKDPAIKKEDETYNQSINQ